MATPTRPVMETLVESVIVARVRLGAFHVLPQEMIEEICSFLNPDHTNKKDLLALCLTCRTMGYIAMPMLYRTVSLSVNGIGPFARAIMNSRVLAEAVRNLEVPQQPDSARVTEKQILLCNELLNADISPGILVHNYGSLQVYMRSMMTLVLSKTFLLRELRTAYSPDVTFRDLHRFFDGIEPAVDSCDLQESVTLPYLHTMKMAKMPCIAFDLHSLISMAPHVTDISLFQGDPESHGHVRLPSCWPEAVKTIRMVDLLFTFELLAEIIDGSNTIESFAIAGRLRWTHAPLQPDGRPRNLLHRLRSRRDTLARLDINIGPYQDMGVDRFSFIMGIESLKELYRLEHVRLWDFYFIPMLGEDFSLEWFHDHCLFKRLPDSLRSLHLQLQTNEVFEPLRQLLRRMRHDGWYPNLRLLTLEGPRALYRSLEFLVIVVRCRSLGITLKVTHTIWNEYGDVISQGLRVV